MFSLLWRFLFFGRVWGSNFAEYNNMDRQQRYDHRCKIKKFGRYNESRSVRYRRRCVNMRILERVHELPDVILQYIYEHIAA